MVNKDNYEINIVFVLTNVLTKGNQHLSWEKLYSILFYLLF